MTFIGFQPFKFFYCAYNLHDGLMLASHFDDSYLAPQR